MPVSAAETPSITPAWPPQDPSILAAMEAAFADGTWGQYRGPHTERLADELRAHLNVEHVLLVCSGTLAVQVALRALKVDAGDEVLLAGYDFAGNFRAIDAIGATPVLVDVKPESVLIDSEQFTSACGPKTRACVVSHLHGAMAPMPEIIERAKSCGLAVVEDACQAHGARIDGRAAGMWGDVGVLSFGGTKLLSAGRGGAIFTNRADVFQRAKVFSEQGNHAFPLSQLQAIVLSPQLARLDERHAIRQNNVARLLKALAPCRALRPIESTEANISPAYYKVGFWFDAEAAGIARDEFIAKAQAAGVPLDAGFRGFTHRSPSRSRRVGLLENAAAASERVLVLHHPVLLEAAATIDRLAARLRSLV
jgi:perosamine synthetase